MEVGLVKNMGYFPKLYAVNIRKFQKKVHFFFNFDIFKNYMMHIKALD